ncbi:hypothetical protein N0V82_005943 [Gnomoniopsis sp. IMI 355080]|nr:hypothetical protein N0V82_005943 [Gnomoniopsis sp. IMI 355080]
MEKLTSNFKPLAPDGHQSVGTVYLGESTTELLPHIVVAQWLADKAAGRDTLVVLESELERSFLTEDLKKEQVLAAEEIGTSLPEPSGSDKGRRLSLLLPNMITTTFLDWYAVGKKAGQPCPFNACSTIMFNLGWGNVQFSTAMCLVGVAAMINEAADTGRRSELLLCVIRDGHNKASCSLGVQTLALPSAPSGKPTVIWHKLKSYERDLKETFQTMSGPGVILTDRYDLPKSSDQSVDQMEEYLAFIGPAIAKHLLVNEDMRYLGPVSGLDHILLHPYTSAWMYDEDSGHVVHQEKALRSQAEIRHIMGVRGTDGAIPRIDCFMSEAEFGNLPETRPPSYSTIELDKLLLVCIGLEVRHFAKLFLEFPNYRVTIEQVRQLEHRKLVRESTGDESLLFGAYNLTRFGTAAFGLIRTTNIESFATITILAEVCCLKGTPELEDRRDKSAILDAMTSLAVILSTREHISLIPLVLFDVKEQYLGSDDEEYHQLIEDSLCGVAAPLRWRGPI